jgi:hypothetical protein
LDGDVKRVGNSFATVIPMRVRIPMKAGVKPQRVREADRNAAAFLSDLCRPVMLIAYVMAAWRILYELRWGHKFGIDDGIWSHWQAWGVVAFLSHLIWSRSRRHARQDCLYDGL